MSAKYLYQLPQLKGNSAAIKKINKSLRADYKKTLSGKESKRRWGTRQPSCMRSALHRIRWCLPRALSQAVPCSTPSARPPAMLPSS